MPQTLMWISSIGSQGSNLLDHDHDDVQQRMHTTAILVSHNLGDQLEPPKWMNEWMIDWLTDGMIYCHEMQCVTLL